VIADATLFMVPDLLSVNAEVIDEISFFIEVAGGLLGCMSKSGWVSVGLACDPNLPR
jgi:hypothetical protein